MKQKFKIGLDIHGVLDTFSSIVKLSQILIVIPSVEVHIITGNAYTDKIKDQLDKLGVQYEYFFSITDELAKDGLIEWRDGYPWCDDNEVWDKAKAEYCKKNNIDLLLDDSEKYGSYFDKIDTVYCQIHNPSRKLYKIR